MRVVDLLVAEERLVGSHFRDGRDYLVARGALGVLEGAVDLGDGHASELQDVDGVGLGAAYVAVVRGGHEHDGVQRSGIGEDEGEEDLS